jgi:FAD/FMN-containing dehydrogenase
MIRVIDASQVSEAVKYCEANKLPLSVRSGGHDLWGHSIIADAVIIDIRELNTIELADDKTSVKIGGGTQVGPLVDFLEFHGRATAVTWAGIVGYTGKAFSRGFGPLVNTFGLGVD